MSFSSIFKTMVGVGGGIALFKGISEISQTINECREIYDKQIQNNFTVDRPQQSTPIHDNTELKKDAVNALVNLGYKVRDSKEKVEIAITRGGCNTIQEVIKYVLQNNSNS
jgi:Holliday junction resolvasome RuvABC DNA-binding subunit